jgi:DNA replication protein DnaC
LYSGEKRLLRLQRQLAGYKLLIIDELGYVPLSQTSPSELTALATSRETLLAIADEVIE